MSASGASDEFYVGLTCDEIGEWCQSEPWACCSAGFCTMETEEGLRRRGRRLVSFLRLLDDGSAL